MLSFEELGDRQREIYQFIRSKIETRGYGPTVREIGLAFDIKSPNGVMRNLQALEKKGLIKREGFSARAMQLLSDPVAIPPNQQDCLDCQRLQEENDKLKLRLQVERDLSREVMEQKFCSDCQRRRDEW